MKRIVFHGLLCLTLSIQGALGQDFEVSPVRLEFNAEPGENQTRVVNVKNHGNRRSSFMVTISDFLPEGDGRRKTLPPNTTRRSAANWLNINPSFFELNPGEQLPVQVTMLVPTDAHGAAWCMLHVQPAREQTIWDADVSLGAGVSVSGRIGVPVFQSPSSNTNHSVRVSSLVEVPTDQPGIRKFAATIDNLGDKVTLCRVLLIASHIETAQEKEFPAFEVETFPKMSRTVEVSMPTQGLQPGTYAIAVIVDYGTRFALEGAQIIVDVN